VGDRLWLWDHDQLPTAIQMPDGQPCGLTDLEVVPRVSGERPGLEPGVHNVSNWRQRLLLPQRGGNWPGERADTSL